MSCPRSPSTNLAWEEGVLGQVEERLGAQLQLLPPGSLFEEVKWRSEDPPSRTQLHEKKRWQK